MGPTLVILAAGAAKRFGGPKQLEPIGPSGETLLEYAAFDALRAGFARIVLVIRPESEGVFRALLDRGMALRVPVDLVFQRQDAVPESIRRRGRRSKPWGTGHAVLEAGESVAGPFAVVNADDFYGASSYQAMARFLGGEREALDLAVVGFPIGATLSHAGSVSRALLDLDERGRLRGIVELFEVWKEAGRIIYRDVDGASADLTGRELVSMNMWGLDRAVLPEIQRRFDGFLARSGHLPDAEFVLPEAIRSLVSGGAARVTVIRGAGDWCGMTYSEDSRRTRGVLAALVDRGRYPRFLWG